MADREAIPQHIGYIVDGNRRWAKGHGLPTYEGHLAGYNAIIEVVLASIDAGVKYVSAYTFSTENWKRSESEVSKIMGLVLRLLTSDIHILQDNGIRLKVLGSRDRLSKSVLKAIDEAESKTAENTRGTLAVCFNYGGQLEIVDACKKIVQEGIAPEDITTELITEHLYVPEVPPLDVVVRTSGEQRTSNFMLWRAAYSEFIFLEKLWPDMTKDDVTAILEEYSRRGRRFGG
jgi:undecaprenyl diphosphate synthase